MPKWVRTGTASNQYGQHRSHAGPLLTNYGPAHLQECSWYNWIPVWAVKQSESPWNHTQRVFYMLYLQVLTCESPGHQQDVFMDHVDGLMQGCSSALAMELLQSCTKPMMWDRRKGAEEVAHHVWYNEFWLLNSLWHSHIIWHHWNWSSLVEVIICSIKPLLPSVPEPIIT